MSEEARKAGERWAFTATEACGRLPHHEDAVHSVGDVDLFGAKVNHSFSERY
jgi:hypothetical protein